MNRILLIGFATISTCLLTKSLVVGTYAYSRETIPGIPDASRNPFPTSYFIYVVVRKGTALSVRDVWVKGKCYSATARKVKSPVLIEHDPAVPTGTKDTLVGKTSGDVYQVLLADEEPCNAEDETARELKRGNEVVVFLRSGKLFDYGTAKKIRGLRPAPAM